MAQLAVERPSLQELLVKETKAFMLSNDIYWLKYYQDQGETSNCAKDWEDRVLHVPELHALCHEGNLEEVKRHLKHNTNVNERIFDGPKLIQTRKTYPEEYIGFFLGSTPLMFASQAGYKKLVKYLLSRGASVHLSDSLGITAFTWACLSDHVDVCRLLLAAGVDVNTKERCFGMSPFLLASRANHMKVVKWLSRHGANIHVKNNDGQTALHIAAINKNPKLITFLTAQGLDINERDSNGDTPLHSLVSHYEVDPDNADDTWSKKENQQLKNIFQLMKTKENLIIDINRETNICDPSNTCISMTDGWFAMKALLNAGAKLDAKNNYGRTPIHNLVLNLPAATCSRGYVVTNKPVENKFLTTQLLILLKTGADPTATDLHNQTALDYCQSVRNMVAYKILDSYGNNQNIQVEDCDLLKDSVSAFGMKFSEKKEDFENYIQWVSNSIILHRQPTGIRALIPNKEQRHRLYLRISDWIEVNWAPGEF